MEKVRRSVKLDLEVENKQLGIHREQRGWIPGDEPGIQPDPMKVGDQALTEMKEPTHPESVHEKYLWGLLEYGAKPMGLVRVYHQSTFN